MDKKKALLKLGGRKHLGEMRWKGALELYEKVYCVCTYRDPAWEIEDDRVEIIDLKKTGLTKNLIGILVRTKAKRYLFGFNWLLIYAIRLLNRQWLKKIKEIDADDILCSYGDYDLSDMTFLLAKPSIKGRVVRAYKETRPAYNFLEHEAFKLADKVVFYDAAVKRFLEKKYGADFFADKQVQLNLDENVLPSCIMNSIQYQPKLSAKDGLVHVVILTFRVDSAPNRARDEGRYYYLDMIKRLIDAGFVVHLHCAQYNDDNGVNRYQLLMEENPGRFYMEAPLEMKHSSSAETWVQSCEILSRYDAGILHNIVEKSSVSEFDRINVPHRYFAYQAAHVLPLLEDGHNSVLEKRFAEKKCGFVYHELADIVGVQNLDAQFEMLTYEEYLKHVFER